MKRVGHFSIVMLTVNLMQHLIQMLNRLLGEVPQQIQSIILIFLFTQFSLIVRSQKKLQTMLADFIGEYCGHFGPK